MPAGSVCFATRSISCSACPELNPGRAEPLMVAERNRLKWLMTCGAVVSLVRTTFSSGSICPVCVRTYSLPSAAGSARKALSACT